MDPDRRVFLSMDLFRWTKKTYKYTCPHAHTGGRIYIILYNSQVPSSLYSYDDNNNIFKNLIRGGGCDSCATFDPTRRRCIDRRITNILRYSDGTIIAL